MAMQIAIAHAAAVHDQAVIQQGAIAIRRGGHFFEEIRQQLHVIGVAMQAFATSGLRRRGDAKIK